MQRYNYWVIILILAVLIATFAGYVSAVRNVSAQGKNTVIINDYSFQPAKITIRMGETVTWINNDTPHHTVTGYLFDSGPLSKGQTFQHTFNEFGIFGYHCKPHPYMKGEVIVE